MTRTTAWPALAALLGTAAAGLIWFALPAAGWWPGLLAAAGWGAWALGGLRPARTRLDGWVLVFLATAAAASWLAYDSAVALPKFRVLLAAVLLFYAIAWQPAANLWRLAGIAAGLGVVAAFYFLLSYDWVAEPLNIDVLNRIGAAWQGLRPALALPVLHPNVAASLMGITLPYAAAAAWQARRRRTRWLWPALLALAVMLPAFLLTTSRGGWGAVTAVALLGVLWLLWLRRWPVRAQSGLFAALLLTIPAVTLLLPLLADALPERLVALAAGAGGRPALWRGALHLIADYGLSGGGLHSFAALYSQYVLVIPYYFVGHAHNLLLNVTLEQGVLGGAALYGLLLHAGWLLWRADGLRNTDNALRLLSWATLASLGILLLHSIVDDPLYGEPGTPLLLMAAGGCALLARLAFAARAARPVRAAPAAAMAGLLLGVGLLLAWWPLPAQVTALRGALTMNRVDLAGWPPGEWDTGANAAALAPAAELLAAAADADAGNVTAQYRLGLVALEARMFETAVFHLEQAHAAAPTHRGVTKTLGYSYVWLGELDQARQTLAGVAETADEMAVYAWWWEQQGRPDLAAQAAAMRP